MSKYLEFLNYLLSLGPKLPAAVAIIETIVAECQKLVELFASGVGATTTYSLSAEEVDAKAKLLAAYSAEGVSGPLDRILAFLEQYPQLVTLILTLLAK